MDEQDNSFTTMHKQYFSQSRQTRLIDYFFNSRMALAFGSQLKNEKFNKLFLIIFLFLSHGNLFSQKFPVQGMIGVNLRREDPTYRLGFAGWAREYHDWPVVSQNNLHPDNTYLYPLGNGTEENFDVFYQNIKNALMPGGSGTLPICATLNRTIPAIAGGSGDAFDEYKPYLRTINASECTPLSKSECPRAYLDYADWAYQFSSRYGSSPVPSNTIKYGNSNNAPPSGLNRVGYVEIWNEPDKWWKYPTNETQFTPKEYAALLSAAIDANYNSFKARKGNGPEYNTGVRGADSNLKIAIGAPSNFSNEPVENLGIPGVTYLNYIDNIRNEFNALRPAGTSTFDDLVGVINYHHYSEQNVNFQQFAVSPEEDIVSGLPLKQWMSQINPQTSTQESWLSEFGYDTDGVSPISVQTINANGEVADRQEVQGRYLTRSLLEIAYAKWDRAAIFDLRDEDSKNTSPIRFRTSGVLKDKSNFYAPKKSYYYVYTMSNTLKDTKFAQELTNANQIYNNSDPNFPRVYFFEPFDGDCINGNFVYAVWLPTHSNFKYADPDGDGFFKVPATVQGPTCNKTFDKATMIVMQPGDIDGVKSSLLVKDGFVWIPKNEVNERPIFIKLGISTTDLALNCVPNMQAVGISCNAVKASWSPFSSNDLQPGEFVTHYQVYYYEKNDSQESLCEFGCSGSNCIFPVFDISDPDWVLYDDQLSANATEVVIAGLKKLDDKYLILVRAVTNFGRVSGAGPICFTCASTSVCDNLLPFDIVASVEPVCLEGLFDDNQVTMCTPPGPLNNEYAGEWTEFGIVEGANVISPCLNQTSVTISYPDINQPNLSVVIQTIAIYDGTGGGRIRLEYSLDGTNFVPISPKVDPVLFPDDWYSYTTNYLFNWQNFSLPTLSTGVKSIRITKLDATARIKRVAFFGHLYQVTQPTGNDLCCGNEPGIKTVGTNINSINYLPDVLNMANSPLAANFISTKQHVFIKGTLVIGNNPQSPIQTPINYGFSSSSRIIMDEGAKIRVNNGCSFEVSRNTVIQGCEKMWRGIEARQGSKVTVSASTIRDAERALSVLRQNLNAIPTNQTYFNISGSKFQSNLYGVYVGSIFSINGTPVPNDISPLCSIIDTDFDGVSISDLKSAYQNQVNWEAVAHTGVVAFQMPLFNVTGTQSTPSTADQVAAKFQRMRFGMNLDRTNCNVNYVRFENLTYIPSKILPGSPQVSNGTLPVTSKGILAQRGSLNQMGFSAPNGSNNALESFVNVYLPIEMLNMKFNVRNNVMQFVNRSIIAKSSSNNPQINQITNNKIYPSLSGIELGLNTQPGILVNKNEIKFNTSTTAFCIGVQDFANPVNKVYDIRNNDRLEIRSGNGASPTFGAGIYTNNVKSANIQGNFIDVRNYTLFDPGANLPNVHAILQTNAKNNTICSNTITGWTPQYGMGITSELTNGYYMTCNSTSNLKYGLNFRMNNQSVNGITINTMNNHDVGLLLGNTPNMGTALVGTQEYRSNRWEGGYSSGNEAVWANPTNVPLNLFLVQKDDPILGPDNVVPSAWFEKPAPSDPNPPTLDCSNTPIPCNDNQFVTGGGRNLEGKTFYRSVAKGEVDLSAFSNAYQWMLRREIYRDIKEIYGDHPNDYDYQLFMATQTPTTVGSFYELDQSMAKLANWEPDLRQQMAQQSASLQGTLDNLQEQVTQFNALPPSEQVQILQNHTEPILNGTSTQKQAQLWDLEDQLRTSYNAQLNTLYQMNAAIAVSAPYELNEKEINGIFLSSFFYDSVHLSEEQFQRIEQIAALCPQEGGFGMYKARALYTLLTGRFEPAWEQCYDNNPLRPTESRQAQKEVSLTPANIAVWPNPSTNGFNLLLPALEVTYRWELYTSTGRLSTSCENALPGLQQITTDGLPDGVYYLQVMDAAGRSWSKKLVLLKQ